jgi:uncharacterized membrane protein
MLFGFIAYFVPYVLLRHAAFETAGYDLGNVSQSMWHSLRGNLLAMTTMEGIASRWALHFEPILLLFVPVYALFPSPVILTVLQAVIVAVGAVPVFWIGRDCLGGAWAGVVYAWVYLMLPALQAAVVFDFHGVTLAATFLAFALWALLQERYKAFGIAALLAMSCKEDMPLLILMMGLYILLVRRHWRAGSATIAASLAWFVLANFVLIPAHSPSGDNIHIVRYGGLGNSMHEVIISILAHPLRVLALAFEGPKLLYWVQLFMPVAFTSLLDPALLLLSLPSLAINTLSDDIATYTPNLFHYTAPIVPFIVVSSITGVAWLGRRLGRGDEMRRLAWQTRLLIVVFAAGLAYHAMTGYTPLRIGFHWPGPDAHDEQAGHMVRRIPPQASVSATNSLVPHLANRARIYIFPKVEDAEYIALDTKSSYFPFGDRQELCEAVRSLAAGTVYGVVYSGDGLLLLQRGEPDRVKVTPSAICEDGAQTGF